MKKTENLKGSYTIEAALLMGILLPLFAAVIYLGFFLHDKSFLQSAAFETAVCVSLHEDEKDLDGNRALNSLLSGRLLGTRDAQGQVSSDKQRVTVSCGGDFTVPGMTERFFGRKGLKTGTVLTMNLERPSRRIQKIRGAVKVIQTFRRTLE